MTTKHIRLPSHLSLDATGTGNQNAQAGPSRFARPVEDSQLNLDALISSLCASKRIVCINGAGVSTAAQIPDFRGSAGLFSNSRKGKESMKDLFHVKSLHSSTLLAAHHAMITELASLAHSAHPTSFHHLLKVLDDQGRLLRVYTQNIDGLEAKTGMRVGLPPKSLPKGKKSAQTFTTPSNLDLNPLAPRVIPLHGTLSTLNCSHCHLITPLLPYLPLPPTQISCPECQLASTIRQALSERQRRSGTLRPSVVLYGEEHSQGESIGAIVERDIRGTGGKLKEGKVDFLVVAGTSLSIPGIKRIIKEMSKALHCQEGKGKGKEKKSGSMGEREERIRVVFVNDEPPKNPAEWAGVFDVWVQGDVQDFAKVIQGYMGDQPVSAISKSTSKTKVPIPSTPKKTTKVILKLPPTPVSLPKPQSQAHPSMMISPTKTRTPTKSNRKMDSEDWLPLTPRATPPSPSRKRARTEENVEPTTPTKRRQITQSRTLRALTPPMEF